MSLSPEARVGTDGSAGPRLLAGTFCLASGVTLAVAFHLGVIPGIRATVLILLAVAVVGLTVVRVGPLSLLPRLLIVLYALPFSVLLGYLWSPDFVWMSTPQGIEVIKDQVVVSSMALVGAVGLLGLLAGFLFIRPDDFAQTPAVRKAEGRAALDPAIFLFLLVAAVSLSAISAPPGTILEAGYATLEQGSSLAERINFPAAGLVAYLVLIVLFIDAESETRGRLGTSKVSATVACVIIIVVYFQLLRGDRDSIGLIAALMCLYLTSPLGASAGATYRSLARRRMPVVLVPAVGIVLLYVVLGWARSALSQPGVQINPTAALLLGFQYNTWTAVLWTNLSVAWEYHVGMMDYRWGSTYIDYLLSLPPGPVTTVLGFDRPFEAWQGLAWENPLALSAGGLHVVVAPFRNFGAWGVLLVLTAFGAIGGIVERHGLNGRFFGRQLWASTLCVSFLWFWYGDMPMIRAMMIVALLYLCYRLLLNVHVAVPPRERSLSIQLNTPTEPRGQHIPEMKTLGRDHGVQ